MYYPEELLEEVRSRNDIVAVVSQYVKMNKRGANYFGCCPFHSEKTPSFSVSPSKQMYYCFGCGAGGNVLTFVMEYENYTFQEAVKYLADRAGITLPEGETTEEERQAASLRSRLLEANKEAARYYYFQLKSPQGRRAWEYFQGRGLSEETIRRFGLGYSPMYRDDLYQYLRKKGYSDEVLNQSGLVKITERGVNDRFWNRAMFPIMDANSRVIGFGGRVMGDGEPKYLNSPETRIFDKGRNLYGLNLARKSRKPYFLLCEGYMDVIAMHQAGFDCAVASLGTAFTQGHALLIKRYVKEVILTYDSDGAGVKAAMRAIPILKEAGLTARVLNMRPYKDPDEFIVHEGAAAFQERIDQAINSFLYECDVLRSQYDFADPEQKTRFHRAVAGKLTEFPDELERNNYLEAVCSRHQIPPDALRDMVRRVGAARPVGEETPRPEVRDMRRRQSREKDEGLLEAQRLVLSWAFSDEGKPECIREYLTPGDFTDAVCGQMAQLVWAAWKEGRQPEPASLMNHFLDSEEERSQVAAIFNTELPPERNEEEKKKILAESIRRIRKNSLDQAARRGTDRGRLQEIIRQKARVETRAYFSEIVAKL